MNIRILFLILAWSTSLSAISQNKHLHLGYKNSGICFGNSAISNGIRFNIWDKKAIKQNGINLTLFSKTRSSNGLSVGIYSDDSISNGLKIGLLGSGADVVNGVAIGLLAGAYKMNGLAIGGLIGAASKFNGVGIGIILLGDTLNGLYINALTICRKGKVSGVSTTIYMASYNQFKGVCISGLHNDSKELTGLSVGVYNKTLKLKGVQLGLWNVALHKRRLKRLPFINFSFRKTV